MISICVTWIPAEGTPVAKLPIAFEFRNAAK
jgi:hypothetical protein